MRPDFIPDRYLPAINATSLLAVAAAFVYGRVAEPQFSDAAVRDPAIVALRGRVTAAIDPSIAEDRVSIAVTLKDGRQFDKYIEHAVGSKFAGLAAQASSPERIRKLMDFCW